MEDTYTYVFTLEEISDLVKGIITAKVDDELFIKNYSDDSSNDELIQRVKNNIRRYDALLDKIRRDAK